MAKMCLSIENCIRLFKLLFYPAFSYLGFSWLVLMLETALFLNGVKADFKS